MKETITLWQLYKLFSELKVKDRKYEELPTEVDGIGVDIQMFFNVLQKEIYSHSIVYMN